jgi:hypothetical protein
VIVADLRLADGKSGIQRARLRPPRADTPALIVSGTQAAARAKFTTPGEVAVKPW